ncbi:beta-ketoacyl synthase N-terminal-like domain-containing protein [Aquisalimonas lutea]|uniref:beta-ketoacyl synthase N-terminal-like domain-containing protein n=1 Tax=Aquisalimonas lutea TaxID=1327750 RepID=UPI0025B59E49|nr:beta-ketoacyl synthase N-terminal-like domain-containing protein [Aquisalimonas lutea]MDN3517106.1 beta-ketoacyl synthase N-terminal-like domain-containing protein [Aquisalimonas lutea]
MAVAADNPPAAVLGAATWTACGYGAAAQARSLRQGGAAPSTLSPEMAPGAAYAYHLLADAPAGLLEVLAPVVAAALDDAGLRGEARQACGVFVGSSSSTVAEAEQVFRGQLDDPAAVPLDAPGGHGRLPERLAEAVGLGGPRFYFGTACSSSANALLHAQRMIARGALDHAVVVGVERSNWLSLFGFDSLMLLSGGRGRPLDRDRDGLVLGEGVSAMVIGPDTPDAPWRLLGGASRVDTETPTNSSPESIAATIRAAMAAAAVDGDEITAIKAHGTGTPGNDLAECTGLRQCLGETLPPVTSLKGGLGHTMGACGIVEIAATMACVDAGFWPPSAGFRTPDPELGVTPVAAPVDLRHGRFLMNFFGFGGNNTACVIERHGD